MNIKKYIRAIIVTSACLVGINTYPMGMAIKDVRTKLATLKRDFSTWNGTHDNVKRTMLDTIEAIEKSPYANKEQRNAVAQIRATILARSPELPNTMSTSTSSATPSKTTPSKRTTGAPRSTSKPVTPNKNTQDLELARAIELSKTDTRTTTTMHLQDIEMERALALSRKQALTHDDSDSDDELAQAIALSQQTTTSTHPASTPKNADADSDAVIAQAIALEEANAPYNTEDLNEFDTYLLKTIHEKKSAEQDKAINEALYLKMEHIKNLLNKQAPTSTPPAYTVLGNTGQTGATCGSYAVVNAKAIQNLVDKNKTIDTAHLRQEAQQYKKLCTLQNVAFDELNNLINQLSIPIFFVDTQGAKNEFYITNSTLTNDQDIAIADLFLTFYNNIKENKAATGHFVINTGGHWITVSVVKKQGHKPHLYYTDTGNQNGAPIAHNSPGYLFIQKIWGILK